MKTGDRRVDLRAVFSTALSPAIAARETNFYLGLTPPGFMLPPASRVGTFILVQSFLYLAGSVGDAVSSGSGLATQLMKI